MRRKNQKQCEFIFFIFKNFNQANKKQGAKNQKKGCRTSLSIDMVESPLKPQFTFVKNVGPKTEQRNDNLQGLTTTNEKKPNKEN